ncbi:hypothetical protein [Thiomicrorhabdus sp.]|uniref:hypothetical protein n=1 Tax=Thiomicrorhabdus sp. TaxID=2039724 RepID=UPI0029C7D868|nr:hypothetical protein [Thiomicrorhabdus sp.]
MLITSISSDFSKEFQFLPGFNTGSSSLSLTSITKGLNPLTSGFTLLFTLLNESSSSVVEASPFLQVLENHTASFNVGRQVPFVVSIVDQDTGQSIRNIERRNIGLSVTIQTQVRPDGLISVDLKQNLSSISEALIDGASDLITDDQTLETNLQLEQNKVYAIGGLTDRRITKARSGLPFLPALDSRSKTNATKEIVIFIETSLKPFPDDQAIEQIDPRAQAFKIEPQINECDFDYDLFCF